VEEKLEGRLIA
jgi:hypothetical protein